MAEAEFPPASFSEIPIIFISTHGVYDLTDEPVAFTVPDNVYIFETQTIGNVCMTPIDKPLWNLMNNREAFISYFKGKGDLTTAAEISASGVYDEFNEDNEDDTPATKHRDYKKIFRNMHFYMPGDTIYNRTLSIGGGSDGARRSYSNMGFYRFDVGDSVDRYPDGPNSKIRPLQPLRTSLIEDESLLTSQQEMIDEVISVQPDVEEGAIFIFSSCASFWEEDDQGIVPDEILNRRIELIESTQQRQDMELMTVTMAGPSAHGTNNSEMSINSLPPSRNIRIRSSKKSSAIFAPAEEEDGEAFGQNNNKRWIDRDPRFGGPGANAAFAEVNAAAAARTATRAAAVGKQAVFILVNGTYKQITTPISANSNRPDLLFSPRDIRDAKKAHGKVYGFKTKSQQFYLLGGGRVTRKSVPQDRRRNRTHRRRS